MEVSRDDEVWGFMEVSRGDEVGVGRGGGRLLYGVLWRSIEG